MPNDVGIAHQVFFKKPFLLLFFFPLFLFVFSGVNVFADTYDCRASLYSGQHFTEPKDDFSIFEKVNLKITCNDLSSGNYNITSYWINPQKEVKRQNDHAFDLEKDSGYVSYSWLKLLKRGPLKRIVTGQDFGFKEYGEWTVSAYMNGKEIVSKKFTMN